MVKTIMKNGDNDYDDHHHHYHHRHHQHQRQHHHYHDNYRHVFIIVFIIISNRMAIILLEYHNSHCTKNEVILNRKLHILSSVTREYMKIVILIILRRFLDYI